MPNIASQHTAYATLRQTAESRLRTGSAPETHGRTLGAPALMLLHKLASDPATASDALKLLHELQVHQVELDLQFDHLNEASHALEQSVQRLTELIVLAPAAYFMVSPAGVITEGNLVGARMLGVEQDDVGGQNLIHLVAADSRASLLALLQQVHRSGLRHSCRVQALDTARHKWLEVIASASPDTRHCLVVVAENSETSSASLQA